jgi:hypothetical protein
MADIGQYRAIIPKLADLNSVLCEIAAESSILTASDLTLSAEGRDHSSKCQGTLTIMMRCLPLSISRAAIISGRWLCSK